MVYQGSYDLRRDVDKLRNNITQLGEDMVDYILLSNTPAVLLLDGGYKPSQIVFNAYMVKPTGTSNYNGTLKLYKSSNGVDYSFVREVYSNSITVNVSDDSTTYYRCYLYDHDILLDVQTVPVIRNNIGNAGKGYDFIYYTSSNSTPPATPSDNVYTYTSGTGHWTQLPVTVTEQYPYCYISYATSDENGAFGHYSKPVLWAKYSVDGTDGLNGEDGADGEGLEMIFQRTSDIKDFNQITSYDNPSEIPINAPASTSNNNKSFQETDYVPKGWTDDQQGVTLEYPYEYVSMRTKTPNDDGDGVWGAYNTPRLWATYSEDTMSVFLGNESQLFSANNDGSLNNDLIFEIPFYCYKGTNLHPCKCVDYTELSNMFTIVSYTDCTASNNGLFKCKASKGTTLKGITHDDIPLVFQFDDETITLQFSIAKSIEGEQGAKGNTGNTGQGYDFAYYTTASTNVTSKPDGTPSGTNVNQWCRTPKASSEQYPLIWISYRISTNGVWGGWSTASLWSRYGSDGAKGDDGSDGEGLEFIFRRSSSAIDWTSSKNNSINPSKLAAVNSPDYVPSGWADDALGVSLAYQYEYCCIRTKTIPNGSTDGVWGKFGTPFLWSKYAETKNIYVKYSDYENPTSFNQTSNNPSKSDGSLYKYIGYCFDAGETAPTSINAYKPFTIFNPEDGLPGDNGYVHIKYSNVASPTSASEMNETGGLYIGVYTDNTKTDSNDPSKYTWTLVKGYDGVSPDVNTIINTVQSNLNNDDIDADTLNGLPAASFMNVNPTMQELTQTDGGTIQCYKWGNLVLINIIGWSVTSTSTNGWVYFKTTKTGSTEFTIPSGYRPSYFMNIGAGNTAGNVNTGFVIALETNGKLRTKNNCFSASGESQGLYGTFIFFHDNRTEVTLSGGNTSIKWGSYYTATLKDVNGKVLAGKTVTFSVNGRSYARTTDSGGVARLLIRLNAGSYSVSVSFNADDTYKSTSFRASITVSVSTPSITADTKTITPTTPFTGRVTNGSDGLRTVVVTVYSGSQIIGSGVTDDNGYFSCYHSNDYHAGYVKYNNTSQTVTIKTDSVNSCLSTGYLSKAYTFKL